VTEADLGLIEQVDDAVPIWPIAKDDFAGWVAEQPAHVRDWLGAHRFEAKPGSFQTVPGKTGRVQGVALGVGRPATLWNFAPLTQGLPAGRYRLEPARGRLDAAAATHAALGWAYGGYRFARYRQPPKSTGTATLVWPDKADRDHVAVAAAACTIVRNLINTPAGDLGPADLAAVAVNVAGDIGAVVETTVGSALLTSGYPMVYAVGRAGRQEPRLIDIRWGEDKSKAPRVTLVGKGVCFDTGGLDIKPPDNMLLQKKDMAGAAICIGLLQMIASSGLDVSLRVLLPMVENSISSESYHPGDVLFSRKGLTVEIGNTDAEGRLILADALAEADREAPDLLVDFATLTGAARTALGPDLPALYGTDDDVANALLAVGMEEADPAWRMPLWAPYGEMLESKIADLNNVGGGAFAGSITAALFLQRFVTRADNWLHIDLFGWSPKPRPGRPEGAEPQSMRAVYRLIRERYYGRAKKAKRRK
jgi:leucyl aminopeptidase